MLLKDAPNEASFNNLEIFGIFRAAPIAFNNAPVPIFATFPGPIAVIIAGTWEAKKLTPAIGLETK